MNKIIGESSIPKGVICQGQEIKRSTPASDLSGVLSRVDSFVRRVRELADEVEGSPVGNKYDGSETYSHLSQALHNVWADVNATIQHGEEALDRLNATLFNR